MDFKDGFSPASRGHKYNFCCSRLLNNEFGVFINIAIGVAANDDRFLPFMHSRRYVCHDNRLSEYRAVKYGTDRPVRALPLLLKAVFLYSGRIGGNSRTLDPEAELLYGMGRFNSDTVVRLIPVPNAEVIIPQVDIQVRIYEFFFYELPHYPGHLIPVHFNNGIFHSDLFSHDSSSSIHPGKHLPARELPDIPSQKRFGQCPLTHRALFPAIAASKSLYAERY